MEFPDIYNLDNFHPVKPDVLKLVVDNGIITVYYNDFQIDSILSADNYCYIYNLNGVSIDKILGNKVIRVNKNDYSDFSIGTDPTDWGHMTLYNNSVFKLNNAVFIIVNINYNGECIIYIYDNNYIITQPSCDGNFVSYAPRNILSLIHKTDGTFAYGIVFGCKDMDSSRVNNYLVKMKYYNYYKGLIMIPSECGKIELYYYKYVINNVVYLALHKMVNNNTFIFATKDKKNRVKYDFNKFTKNLEDIPRQIEISIKNYNSQNGLLAFHTETHI